MIGDIVRRSIGLKVSILLAVVTLITTGGVGMVIIRNEATSLEELTVNKARLSARAGALVYGRVLDEGIDSNVITVGDAFDTKYEEIRGYNWAGKPKYHTRYDFFTDRAMVEILDRFSEGEEIVGALGQDVNGYIPTYSTRYMQPISGDAEKDLVGHRAKVLAKYDVALKAGASEQSSLVQDYLRDTGERMIDVSAPIYVKGKHWGAFRVIVSVEQIEKAVSNLVWTLVVLFGGFAILSTGIIFVMIQRSMKPLVVLTGVADELSTGERLDEPIKVATIDEVGRMAKAMERLRASLKLAMSRLGE